MSLKLDQCQSIAEKQVSVSKWKKPTSQPELFFHENYSSGRASSLLGGLVFIGGGPKHQTPNVSWHPCLKHIFSKNLPKGRAQRVPSTRHFYRYPTRLSFENHRVSGDTKYQVLPGISGIPLNTKKHGNTQHNLRCLRVKKVPEPARYAICHERRDQWLCKKNSSCVNFQQTSYFLAKLQ